MEPGTAKMLVLRRFVSFAFGRTVRPAEGLVRREAGCAGRYVVCRAAQVGARACSGGATCRATYLHSAAAITKKVASEKCVPVYRLLRSPVV